VICALALYQIMQEQPSVTLDTTIQSILNLRAPGGKPPADPRFARITLRHLVESTCALDNGFLWKSVEAAAAAKVPLPPNPEHYASLVAAAPLTGDPGDPARTEYSNVGYIMAGHVVARLRKADTFLAAIAPLLKPLGMTRVRTSITPFSQYPGDEARGHIHNLPTVRSVMSPDRPLVASQYGNGNIGIIGGTGGLSAALPDIARILAVLALRENNPVLKPATLDTLLQNAEAATRTLKGPRPHGYHGFDYVRKVERPGPGFSGAKGGFLWGNIAGIEFNTAGFSYAIAVNGNLREGAMTDWDKRVAAVAEKHAWPSGDLFPAFGMRSFAT
jgi:CubicO group peptidase (beta-lactamase class C family)